MKKYFRKIKYIFLILILLVVNFAIPSQEIVEAKTLRSMKNELSALKEKYQQSQNQKKYTEAEIAAKKEKITSINIEIQNTQLEIVDLTEEIEKLNVEIEEKEKEIKNIMNYYQLSNSESAYLEYIFEAADFTDFIYRMAIAEQLSKYNDNLVDEYHKTIKENEKKKEELAAKTVSLTEMQKKLENEVQSLGDQLGEIFEESVSLEEEIKILEESINLYQNVYKCDLDQDINACTSNQLPSGTSFYRPVASGRVSSNYGPRTYYLNGRWVSDFHYGMDFGGTGHGANVYPIASGKVVAIVDGPSLYAATKRNVCGGTKVFIIHTVNGKKYTSGYYHLANYTVKVGQTVTPTDVIGHVGGVYSIEYWDSCSTAAHLHLQLGTGHYINEYGSYSAFVSRRFDPRQILSLPAEGGWFNGR